MKFLLLFTIFLVSCASDKKPKKEEDPDALKGPERRIVGRIASVSKAGNFVLIQRLGKGTLPGNLIYQSRGPEGRGASLRISGERVRDFYAADLVSGTVETGDAVVAYLNSAEKTDPADEEPEEPEAEDDEITENPSKSPETEQGTVGDQLPETISDSD